LAQLLWQLLDAVAVQVQSVEAGQAPNAGRHLCQLVLRQIPAEKESVKHVSRQGAMCDLLKAGQSVMLAQLPISSTQHM
jgi:hypothetical protein